MHNYRRWWKGRTNIAGLRWVILVGLISLGAWFLAAQSTPAAPTGDEGSLIARYRRVEVASVSDAIEQLMGKRMYMSHRMQPIFTAKFAGFARTVQLKTDEGNSDPAALSGMLAAIDEGASNSVYVMAVEDGADIVAAHLMPYSLERFRDGWTDGYRYGRARILGGGDRRGRTRRRVLEKNWVSSVRNRDRAFHFHPSLSLWRRADCGAMWRRDGERWRHCSCR